MSAREQRVACWLCLLAGLLLGSMAVPGARAGFTGEWPWTRQPVTVCYQTDGAQVSTAYVDDGDEPFVAYPAPGTSGEVVSNESGVLVVRHTVVLREKHSVYLPTIRR